MNRLIIFTILLVCLVCFLHASPLPQDAPQQETTISDMDSLADKAKKMLDSAKGAFDNSDFKETLGKAKTYLEQAGDNVQKEIEKLIQGLKQ